MIADHDSRSRSVVHSGADVHDPQARGKACATRVWCGFMALTHRNQSCSSRICKTLQAPALGGRHRSVLHAISSSQKQSVCGKEEEREGERKKEREEDGRGDEREREEGREKGMEDEEKR